MSLFSCHERVHGQLLCCCIGFGVGLCKHNILGLYFFLGGGMLGKAKLCLLGINIPKVLEYSSHKDLEQGGVRTISCTKMTPCNSYQGGRGHHF